MSKAWESTKSTWFKFANVLQGYMGFIERYPGRAAILWPVTLALAVWWL